MVLVNRCQHPTLLLTSLCWQQHRKGYGAVSLQNGNFICMNRDSALVDAILDYEDELGMVEQRRQEVFNQESRWQGWRKSRTELA